MCEGCGAERHTPTYFHNSTTVDIHYHFHSPVLASSTLVEIEVRFRMYIHIHVKVKFRAYPNIAQLCLPPEDSDSSGLDVEVEETHYGGSSSLLQYLTSLSDCTTEAAACYLSAASLNNCRNGGLDMLSNTTQVRRLRTTEKNEAFKVCLSLFHLKILSVRVSNLCIRHTCSGIPTQVTTTAPLHHKRRRTRSHTIELHYVRMFQFSHQRCLQRRVKRKNQTERAKRICFSSIPKEELDSLKTRLIHISHVKSPLFETLQDRTLLHHSSKVLLLRLLTELLCLSTAAILWGLSQNCLFIHPLRWRKGQIKSNNEISRKKCTYDYSIHIFVSLYSRNMCIPITEYAKTDACRDSAAHTFLCLLQLPFREHHHQSLQTDWRARGETDRVRRDRYVQLHYHHRFGIHHHHDRHHHFYRRLDWEDRFSEENRSGNRKNMNIE